MVGRVRWLGFAATASRNIAKIGFVCYTLEAAPGNRAAFPILVPESHLANARIRAR